MSALPLVTAEAQETYGSDVDDLSHIYIKRNITHTYIYIHIHILKPPKL
jgi:hypothetical protein